MLHDELFGYRPVSGRSVFVVDREGIVRYAWIAEQQTELPDPEQALQAVRALA